MALLLVFAGMGFRMTAVPFHFYAPDVYQGTSNPNAGLLSTLPKIAGLLVVVRVIMASMPGHELQGLGWRIALVMAVLTMTLGNVLALWQDNIRRLLAYSSIAHAGYMLIGVAVGFATAAGGEAPLEINGIGTALFYLGVYCLATIGAFAALNYLGSAERQIDGVDELNGLGRTRPAAALALAVAMFSLAGVPPLAGFWGKLTLFTGALEVGGTLRPWFVGLAVIGAVNAAIAMAYYLRVVAVMYFRASRDDGQGRGRPRRLVRDDGLRRVGRGGRSVSGAGPERGASSRPRRARIPAARDRGPPRGSRVGRSTAGLPVFARLGAAAVAAGTTAARSRKVG